MNNFSSSAINNHKILVVDNEINTLNSLSSLSNKSQYSFTSASNTTEALDLASKEHFDMMLLDSKQNANYNNEFIENIRKFNKDLYIILLTNNKDLPSQLGSINSLNIQGCCQKTNTIDTLIPLVESGMDAISQMNLIKNIDFRFTKSPSTLNQIYLEAIQTLRLSVEAKDAYTQGHSDRVSKYSKLIGKYLNLPDKDLKTLEIGGLFHDIGKIGIPNSILQKNSKLTIDEYEQIKNHPSIGAHILSNSTVFKDIIPIVQYHHEHYDGLGYPCKLAGSAIPFLARITAIADAFDAMTSKRIYRNSLPIKVVKNEFIKNRGTQFDPELTDIFLDILDKHYDEIEHIKNLYKKG